jgi:hypothetical protein
VKVTHPFASRRRRTVLGIPVGHRRHHARHRPSPHAVGQAAGYGVAGAGVATVGYLGWSVIRMATSVKRSVTTVAETVEHGAKELDTAVSRLA